MAVKKKATKTGKKAEKDAIADVFGTAAPAAPKTTSKSKKSDKPQVEMTEEFEGYVALTLVQKALEGVKKQLDAQFKDQEAFDYFHEQLVKTSAQPKTFEGVNGRGSAQFQFKKRSHGFSEDVAAMLDKHEIAYEKSEKIPERFTINPEVLNDQELLGKLAVAIKKMGVEDVIIKQEPVYSYQVAAETHAQIAKIKDETIRAEIIRAVSSIAVAQAKIDGVDAKGGALEAALEILQEKGILSID
jgi:hypothetical protein